MREGWERVVRTVVGEVVAVKAAADEAAALAIHRKHLADAESNGLFNVAPVIRGTAVAGGFDYPPSSPGNAFTVIAVVLFLFLASIVASVPLQPRGHAWTNLNYAVLVCVLVFFGVPALVVLGFFIRRAMAGWAHSGTLHIAHWPLRAGQETRARYTGRTREHAAIQGVTAVLTCSEQLSWSQPGGEPGSRNIPVRSIALDDVAPIVAPDGSVVIEWVLRLPRDAPASFDAPRASVVWMLAVELRIAGAPGGTQEFELLVLPEVMT